MYQDKFTVTLGDYKNITVPQFEAVATEEEIAQVLEMERSRHKSVETVDAPAQNGDTVLIDFAGFLGEEQFEGGTSEGYSLKLGSGSFIPGFEEQLVGSKAGDEVDVNVTFPENYHAADLAGKPVVFKCKVHAVQQEKESVLNDAFAQENYGLPTVEDLKNAVRQSVERRKREQNVSRAKSAVMEQILAKSTVTVGSAFVDVCGREILEMYAQSLQQQGMTLEMYLQYTGTSMEQLRSQIHPQAVERARAAAVMIAIAEAEGITITDEDMAAELSAMAEAYGITVEELQENLDDETRERITMNMLVSRAMAQVITDAAAK